MLSRLLQAGVWIALGGAAGCQTSDVVSVRDMPSKYDAPAPKPVKIMDFAKLARPYEQDRRIQPGDLLEIKCSNLLADTKTGTLQVRVDADGSATLPLLRAPLRLDALTCGEAEQVVSTAYRVSDLIKRPDPSIKILEVNKKKIYVIGAVKNPGMYELRPDESNPLRAILAAGGLTESAGAIVEVRQTGLASARKKPSHSGPELVNAAKKPSQPGPELAKADMVEQAAIQRATLLSMSVGGGRLAEGPELPKEVERQGADGPQTDEPGLAHDATIRFDLSGEALNVRPDQLVLNNGDVVSVEEKKKQMLYVAGSVKRPGEFPMPTDREIHVVEAIGMAGGVNMLSQPTHVLITRRMENGPVVLGVDLTRAGLNPKENIRLMAGDVVSVEEDWASQTRRFFRDIIKIGPIGTVPGLSN